MLIQVQAPISCPHNVHISKYFQTFFRYDRCFSSVSLSPQAILLLRLPITLRLDLLHSLLPSCRKVAFVSCLLD